MAYTPAPLTFTQTNRDELMADMAALIAKIQELNTSGIALTADERKNGVTVGIKRKTFNDYYYENKDNYPDFKPSQTKVTEAQAVQHYFIHTGLAEFAALTDTLSEITSDIQLNSEHFSYDYSSEGRLASKKASENGKPGADSWFNALDERFPQTGPDGGGDAPSNP